MGAKRLKPKQNQNHERTKRMISSINQPKAPVRRFRIKTLTFVGLIIGATALLAIIRAQQVQAETHRGNPFTLAGSWQMVVGVPPGPTFTAYETFTEAGGSVEINSGPGGSTTGIGSWVRTGRRTFLATTVKQQFDEAGNLTLTTKVRREITLSATGDDLSGRDNVDLFDPAGNRLPIEIPAGTFHGVRLAPEPLSH
ncbi:MAG: hypothetical protein KJ070_14125 [Verrucomicrobia bacterium]|nr:hypothetical protein [Verrucomicrobiota bacterium]